jgi:hypothetical protein
LPCIRHGSWSRPWCLNSLGSGLVRTSSFFLNNYICGLIRVLLSLGSRRCILVKCTVCCQYVSSLQASLWVRTPGDSLRQAPAERGHTRFHQLAMQIYAGSLAASDHATIVHSGASHGTGCTGRGRTLVQTLSRYQAGILRSSTRADQSIGDDLCRELVSLTGDGWSIVCTLS